MQNTIVFVGAGGAGLSNLVGILRDLGFHNLIGIDNQPSQITEKLQQKGIQILPHWTYTIKADDILIYSSATEQSEEVQQAKKLKAEQHLPLRIRDYFEFLGEISKYFKTIAFTGTNGKSSSSAMGIFVAKNVLAEFGLGIVGALVPDFWGESYMIGNDKSALTNIFTYILTWKKLNYALVKKYYFLLEACEYQRHFLTLDLESAIITSLELEHTDYFKDWTDYQSAFLELINKVKQHVYVLPNLNSEKILNHPKTVIVEPQHFNFQHIRGEHQQQNASLVAGMLSTLTEHNQQIRQNLEHFHGIRRRMEEIATTEKWAKIFSDYGHVASSLVVGLKALKEKFPERRLICIFQPHQMHRILQGREEFPKALAGYDQTFIYNIYAARESIETMAKEFKKVTTEEITNIDELGELFASHCNSTYLKTFDEVKKILEKAEENDIIVVYSAGDIDYLLRQYLEVM